MRNIITYAFGPRTALVAGGIALGGWVGDAAGIAHIGLNGKNTRQAYADVMSMNVFNKDYAPIVGYDLAGKALGGLGAVALMYRKKKL